MKQVRREMWRILNREGNQKFVKKRRIREHFVVVVVVAINSIS